jgi:hypothetical protein
VKRSAHVFHVKHSDGLDVRAGAGCSPEVECGYAPRESTPAELERAGGWPRARLAGARPRRFGEAVSRRPAAVGPGRWPGEGEPAGCGHDRTAGHQPDSGTARHERVCGTAGGG